MFVRIFPYDAILPYSARFLNYEHSSTTAAVSPAIVFSCRCLMILPGYHCPRKTLHENGRTLQKIISVAENDMTENNTITKTKSVAMSLTNSRKLFFKLRKTDKAEAGLYLFCNFALFYTPMMSVSQLISFSNRPFSCFFLTPQTNPLAEEGKLAALAEKNGLSVADYREYSGLVLGMDGYTEVETQGDHFDVVYFSLLTEGRFLSASDYTALTGNPLAVESGTYYVISNSSETNLIWTNPEATLLTNMVTRNSLPVALAGYTHYELLAGMTPFYVISDEDYEVLSTGLTSEWQEALTVFNIEGEDSYEAANGLYQDFRASFEGSCALPR